MKPALRASPKPKALRCAIYTRKSTEEGLEKEFNSLDAQREAAEAFIKSQVHENWTCLPKRYDDGGFSGGNLERPALTQLLADIEAGAIDIVVTYKVDRLSRSLLDFARLMALFEKHGISFVAVTQQFNTATSMGRLVLNVLLSFAQFEREIISERTRDKIAAARRKGKWAGMLAPLGYIVDPHGNKLRVHEEEAQQVRAIFNLYLERQALLPVVEELEKCGWTTKRWQTRKGHFRGGGPFNKTSLYQLLTHPAYIGKVRYKTEIHKGEHQGIVDPGVWNQVQETLRHHGPGRGKGSGLPSGALLKGLLRCQACGKAMSPTYAKAQAVVRYRYYACFNLCKLGRRSCPSLALSAPAIEQLVVEQLQALAQEFAPKKDGGAWEPMLDLETWKTRSAFDRADCVKALLRQVDYEAGSNQVTLHFHETLLGDRSTKHVCPQPYCHPTRKARAPQSLSPEAAQPTEPRLARLMALALHLDGLIREGRIKNYAELGRVGHVTRSRVSQIMNLLLLAPDIQEQLLFLPPLLRGRDPLHLRRLQALTQTPDWTRQRRLWARLIQERRRTGLRLEIEENPQ